MTENNLQMYKKIINNINSGVAIYEAENNGENFKFKGINKTGLKIDNLAKDEVLGKK